MLSVSRANLNRADWWIADKSLHESEPPVNLAPALEKFWLQYAALPEAVEAFTLRVRSYVGMSFNADLREPTESARERCVQAHEWAHIILGHRGDFWIMWRRPEAPPSFDQWLENTQEHQANMLAAYLLIPLSSLVALRNEPQSYVARTLDVPEDLVERRWTIWRRHGR